MLADFLFAWRQLKKSPGTSLVLIASLGIGIGCVAVVACWIQGVVLNPLRGVPRQNELAVLVSSQGGGNISLPDARDFQGLTETFAGVAASQISPAALKTGNRSEWTYGQVVTANFFELLEVRAFIGRTFLPDEDLKPGGNPVLVISERLWSRVFRKDPRIIGETVELNRHPFTIIGVVPAEFGGTMAGVSCEFWAPISMEAAVAGRATDFLSARNARGFHNVVRLRPSVTLEQAGSVVQAKDLEMQSAFPGTNKEVHHRLLPYSKCPYGAQSLLGSVLYLLLAVAAGVLLIVMANVANLQLARAAGRQREIAIRRAAGASRWQLIRMLLVENVTLALAGGSLGLWLASWGVGFLRAFLPDTHLPIGLNFELEPSTFILVAGIALVTGLIVGLAPASHCVHGGIQDALQQSGRTIAGNARHHRIRSTLVVAEIALAVVLLIGSALCLQGLARAKVADFGFDPRHVLVAGLPIGMHGYNQDTGRVFYHEVLQRLAQTPGVEAVALASWLPLGFEGCKGHGVDVPGYTREPGEDPTFQYSVISPRYFAAMKTELTAGRDFSDADTRASVRVAIVNQAFADRFWPGANPVGKTFRCAGRDRTVIGIAKTGKYNRLSEPAHPFFFLPYQQYVPDLDLRVIVRTKGDPLSALADVRKVVQQIDPSVSLYGALPLTTHAGETFFAQNIATQLMTGLGAVALLLAALGVYSVMSYTVAQRIPEFGIRLALGAQARQLIWHVQRQGLILTGAAVAMGLIGALAGMRVLAGLLYGVQTFAWLPYLGVPLVLALVSVLACWLPAFRASRLDPMVVLRSE